MNANRENAVDEAGTSQDAARDMLRSFCDNGFDSDMEKAALVLGRPVDELTEMLAAESSIDDDLAMKIRGIAQERNIALG